MDDILGYVALSGAQAIDLTQIADDDTSFEEFVQSLLIELGYAAERTGTGPDSGVDIIADKILDEPIGGPRTLRYVVECKHYAHSRRAVRLADVSIPPISDRVASASANGFLLVTSTDLTSSLKRHIEKLNTGGITVQCWDKQVILRYLLDSPQLQARYFPTSLYGATVVQKRPRGKSASYCFSQVKDHQQRYVGVKYIPTLYVSRQLEHTVLQLLRSPSVALEQIETRISLAVARVVNRARQGIAIPARIAPRRYRRDVFATRLDLSGITRALNTFAETVSALPIRLLHAYSADGSVGLVKSLDRLKDGIRTAQDELRHRSKDLFEIADAFGDELRKIEGATEQIGSLQSTLKANLQLTPAQRKEHQARLRRLKTSIKTPAWRHPSFCDDKAIAYAASPQRSGATFVEDFVDAINDMRRTCFSDSLSELTSDIHTVATSMLVLVDIAGTGKTNLCCRIAYNLTAHAFVVFLTAKAQDDVFASIRTYLQQYICKAFPARTTYTLEDNCRWLFKKQLGVILILDGINEAPQFERLKIDLADISRLAGATPIRVLLTSRSEYWTEYRSVLSPMQNINVIEGALGRFSDDEQRLAVQVYLDYYKLKVRLEGSAWEQLKRPLLLRFFCEAYGSPLNRKYRRLPSVSRVSLIKLFDAYVDVKYSGIAASMARQGRPVEEMVIRKTLIAIASRCLRDRSTSIEKSLLTKSLATLTRHWRQILGALLDEDIIIHQSKDLDGPLGRRLRVAFVYEAFMEYLMAQVIIAQGAGSDRTLRAKIERQIAQQEWGSNFRGIATFLLPACVSRLPKSYDAILKGIIEPSLEEVAVPTLLNLWDSHWKSGIWPMIQTIRGYGIHAHVDDVSTYIQEWVEAHDPTPLFETVADDPKTFTRCAGIAGLKVLNDSRVPFNLRMPAIVSVLGTLDTNAAIVGTVLDRLVTELRRGSWPGDVIQFDAVARSVIPRLKQMSQDRRSARDWRPLWTLGVIGESILGADSVVRSDLKEHDIDGIVSEALIDTWYFSRQRVQGSEWWRTTLRLDVNELIRSRGLYHGQHDPLDDLEDYDRPRD